MRLFIALNFSESERQAITQIQHRLKGACISGNFTRQENLHLTLAFLGEISPEKIPKLRQVLTKTAQKATAFSLTYDHLGHFPGRGQEKLWYLGCETTSELARLVQALWGRLRSSGFPLEDREFLPHVTLGRRCVSEAIPYIEFAPITVEYASMELMLSARIDGMLTYTPIFSVKFNDR